MEKNFKNYQMFRTDGKDCFVEVTSPMIDLGKVIVNFVNYDKSKPQGERMGASIPIYLDLNEAKNFFFQASLGGFQSEARAARKAQADGGYKYCKEIYTDLGGTKAEALKERKQERKDAKAEARVMKLTPGAKLPWILEAQLGGGKLQPNGLISMDGRPDVTIRVPMTDMEFRKMGVVVTDQIRLIESKLAFGGNCEVDSVIKISQDTNGKLDKISKNIDRIIKGLSLVFNKVSGDSESDNKSA